jgi:hypothetical protein
MVIAFAEEVCKHSILVLEATIPADGDLVGDGRKGARLVDPQRAAEGGSLKHYSKFWSVLTRVGRSECSACPYAHLINGCGGNDVSVEACDGQGV